MSGAGDVNADGYDDLIAGAPFAAFNGFESGSSYVFYGKAAGYTATVDLAGLDGSNGIRIDGGAAGDYTGQSVSGAGDLNGDGYDDLAIGVWFSYTEPYMKEIGSSYVVFGGQSKTFEHVFKGGLENDLLIGDGDDDRIHGFGGRDTLEGLAGNDLLEGGDNIDHAVYHNDIIEFQIVNTAGELTLSGPESDGADTLIEVERLHFNDMSLAFDLDGNAGTIAKLLGVALGKDNWYNKEFIGIGLDIVDNEDFSFEELMSLAFSVIISPSPSNKDVVKLVYNSLIGQAPSEEELNALTADLLDSGAFTQGGLGVLAANHVLNTSNINLIGLAETGLEYLSLG